MKLYHYTCEHAVPKILAAGQLKPFGFPAMVWLTDLEYPDRAALGLTSHILDCDRLQYRVTVEHPEAVHWFVARKFVPEIQRSGLELAPGVQPGNWWVALEPVEISDVEPLTGKVS